VEWSESGAGGGASQVLREDGRRCAELSELEYRIIPPAGRPQTQRPMTRTREGLGISAGAGACAPVHSCMHSTTFIERDMTAFPV
jgi:hypothetical protein